MKIKNNIYKKYYRKIKISKIIKILSNISKIQIQVLFLLLLVNEENNKKIEILDYIKDDKFQETNKYDCINKKASIYNIVNKKREKVLLYILKIKHNDKIKIIF